MYVDGPYSRSGGEGESGNRRLNIRQTVVDVLQAVQHANKRVSTATNSGRLLQPQHFLPVSAKHQES